MEVPELKVDPSESIFVRDDFYESFQAPKFHDFCSNEEPITDPDSGQVTEAGFRLLQGSKPVQKNEGVYNTETSRSRKGSLSSMTLNPEVPPAVPKASFAGIKKSKSTPLNVSTSVTKTCEKPRTKNKIYERTSYLSTASQTCPAKAESAASLARSENSDPNECQARRSVIKTSGCKTDSSGCEGLPGVESDADVLLESQSDSKDRKRKPIPRGTEGGISRVNTRKPYVKYQKKKSLGKDSQSSDSRPSCSDQDGKVARIKQHVEPEVVQSERRSLRRISDKIRRRRVSGIKAVSGGKTGRAVRNRPSQAAEDLSKVQISLSSNYQFGSSSRLQEQGPACEADSAVEADITVEMTCSAQSIGAKEDEPDISTSGSEVKGSSEDERQRYSLPSMEQTLSSCPSQQEARESMSDPLLAQLQGLSLQHTQAVSLSVPLSSEVKTAEENDQPSISGNEIDHHPEGDDYLAEHISSGGLTIAEERGDAEEKTLLPELQHITVTLAVSSKNKLCTGEEHTGRESLRCSNVTADDATTVQAARTDFGDTGVDKTDPGAADLIQSLVGLQIDGSGSGERKFSLHEESNQKLATSTGEDSRGVDEGCLLQEAGESINHSLPKEVLPEGHHFERSLAVIDAKRSERTRPLTDQTVRCNKRKSVDLASHHCEPKTTVANTAAQDHEQTKAKYKSARRPIISSQSHLSISASRIEVPASMPGQHKKMKITFPQPFRLRTEERGALKEVEFNKKVELYLAAKEKLHDAPFPLTSAIKDNLVESLNTGKPASKSTKLIKSTNQQVCQHSKARAAERAVFDIKLTEKSLRADEERQAREKRVQHEADEEIKKMRKQMIPHAHRMPHFDRPFKPHRSTKTLTIPSSPKFRLKAKRTHAVSSVQE